MKVLFKYIILSSSLISYAMANEEAVHHEPSVFDLKYAVLNFVVLFGFLGWKFKKPLSEMFDKKSEEVKALMNSADKQNKDAEEKLNQFNAKIKNLDSELIQINADYTNDAVSYAKFQHEETQTSIARIKRDLENKLNGEKKELLDELNHEIISKVILNAKNEIAKNADHRKNATQKILTELK